MMTRKGLSRIYEPRFRALAAKTVNFTSICTLVIVIASVVISDNGLSKELEPSAKIQVQRVPDTWAVAATDDSVYFDLGSSALDEKALEAIRRHAAKLKANRGLRVTLIAHTDDLGSSSLELAKGQERLDVIRKRLEDLKVSPGQIHTENHGSEIRAAPKCIDSHCRQSSRRVDFLFER